MVHNMERWYSASGQRFSVRKYAGAPEAGELAALRALAKTLSVDGVRICVGRSDKLFSSIFAGNFKGTDCFAAIISKNAEMYKAGYMGEAFIHECTAMGLGTCWLGKSYSKSAVKAAITLYDGERILCVTPIGVMNEKYSARPRKPLDKLTGLDQKTLIDLPEWQQHAIGCARIAPSAVNGQPWRFVVEGETITVIKTRDNFGYGSLDCGIAMLHIELGAAHGGTLGEWIKEDDRAVFSPVQLMYANSQL